MNVMNQTKRSFTPLIIGAALVLLGGLILTIRLVDFQIGWEWLQFVLPILLLVWGVSKLLRHYLLDPAVLADRPGKAGLLGGLFWSAVGLVWLLDLLGAVPGLEFFGLYWPVVLILFGLGKIADYYRSQGLLQVRAGEIIGVLMLILVGVLCGLVARAQFPLITLPSIDLGGRHVSLEGWFDEKYSWKETESVDAQGVQQIEIANLYGDVIVQGHGSKTVEIELTKAVLASSKEEAEQVSDQVRVTVERSEEGSLRISTNRKEIGQSGSRKTLFKSHFRLSLPEQVPVRVTNQYGDVRVQRLNADCTIRSSYGQVIVDGLVGELDVENQYRQVVVRHLEGPARVSNDRGAVRIEDGVGDLELETAYDSVTVRRQQGSVQVKNRFGRVSLESVTGNAAVEAPGSEVTVSELDGRLAASGSHRGISISHVNQGVELESSNNRISFSQIRGPVVVRSAYADIHASELEAGLQVEAKGTRVSVDDLEGGFEISTSQRPVRVARFGGAGRVQNEYGEIELVADRALEGPLTASTKNAAIRFFLPEGAAAKISAQSPGGKIESMFTREAPGGQALSVFETELGQDGPQVRLLTTYAPIVIARTPE